MKKTFNAINYELLFSPTGDPFVDAGAYALLEFSKRFPECDILELIDKACDIYVDLWNAKLNTFFLNSKITQSSFDVDRKSTCLNSSYIQKSRIPSFALQKL